MTPGLCRVCGRPSCNRKGHARATAEILQQEMHERGGQRGYPPVPAPTAQATSGWQTVPLQLDPERCTQAFLAAYRDICSRYQRAIGVSERMELEVQTWAGFRGNELHKEPQPAPGGGNTLLDALEREADAKRKAAAPYFASLPFP